MTEPDLFDPELRVLECTGCGEPVWGRPTTHALRTTCGYCSVENVRELLPPPKASGDEEPYRQEAPRTSKRVELDFAEPPSGVRRLSSASQLRAVIAASKTALASDDEASRDATEHRLLWSTFALSNLLVKKHDAIRARALLESAYELSLHPVRRALVAARVARTAAFGGATEVAERWLARVPNDLRVPEISSEARLTRVMLARATGDADAMLEALGTEASWPAATRHLAMGLRCDALERKGDLGASRKAYRRGARGAAFAFNATIRTYDLAPRTLRRTELIGFAALGLIVCLFGAMALALSGQAIAAFAILGACLVGMIVLRLL